MLPARILIGPIDVVFRNDERIDGFAVESDDAEIYGLDTLPAGVDLTLVWHWFSPKAEVFAIYRFPKASARAEDASGGPPLFVAEKLRC